MLPNLVNDFLSVEDIALLTLKWTEQKKRKKSGDDCVNLDECHSLWKKREGEGEAGCVS